VNPEYNLLGNEYYTPDIILSTWYQSETGAIPVSGSGYGGKFTGSGFNSMWTDMSEIVRPTRDGIHGREYISTGVDLGRRLNHLSFHGKELSVKAPPRLEIPMPLLFDVIPNNWHRGDVPDAICEAATALGLFTIMREETIRPDLIGKQNIIPLLDKTEDGNHRFTNSPLVMIPYHDNTIAEMSAIKNTNESCIVGVRIDASIYADRQIVELARSGVEVVDLVFDKDGIEKSWTKPRHMKDVLREVHCRLIKEGIRDEITLIASGGIALPEYMAKAIICGADLVTIDLALVVALECRLCMDCARGERCQISLDAIDKDYAKKRIINLIAAWRNQLLEMLGAMGIREVKRLRGETGRCMFFEDLEKETFAPLFGERKA
jgi:hypothetical protein